MNEGSRADELPPHAQLQGATIVREPVRHGNELRWRLTLADGREAMLARLVDELAADPSIRRRYRRDIARVAALELDHLAPVIAWGPSEEAQLESQAPWRLRLVIAGRDLHHWIESHAPAPPDLVASKLAALCRCLAPLHAQGLIVRDLTPHKLVEDAEGNFWLIDIGLARTDILSTRTAASLVLEGSPYTAPELLGRTAVDGRADLYAIGVLGFVALTGTPPFGDSHALLRSHAQAPTPSTIHPGVPPELDALIVALLEEDPGQRPDTATLVADILEGEAALPSRAIARMTCQNCDASLPVGQRLCLGCGKLAVQFAHANTQLELGQRYKIVLRKAKEDSLFIANLRELCSQLAQGEVPALNFVIGDARMYSEAERKRALKLPVTLFNDLDQRTALALQARFAARDIKVVLEKIDVPNSATAPAALSRRQKKILGSVSASTFAIGAIALAAAGSPAAVFFMVPAVTALLFMIIYFSMRKVNKDRFASWGHSLMRLRAAPAALPASDPLVARLAALLRGTLAGDIHELVSRLALVVQRMVDHRGHNLGAAQEIALAVSALEPLVAQVEIRVATLVEIDKGLAELDEGRLVRGLAAADARGEDASTQTRYLEGLDRLRELEVERARVLTGLHEACELARRSVDMGLRVRDEDAEHQRRVAMALAALQSPSPSEG